MPPSVNVRTNATLLKAAVQYGQHRMPGPATIEALGSVVGATGSGLSWHALRRAAVAARSPAETARVRVARRVAIMSSPVVQQSKWNAMGMSGSAGSAPALFAGDQGPRNRSARCALLASAVLRSSVPELRGSPGGRYNRRGAR